MYKDLEKQLYQHIENGDWDSAIDAALQLPPNWDALQRLPSAGEMPNGAIRRVLNHIKRRPEQRANFLFELASNLPDDISAENLNNAAYLSKDSNYETLKFMAHPNFKYSEEHEPLKRAADWWSTYEKAVAPHHFATVKSLYSNNHESITDHRGNSGETHAHILPDLRRYADEVQKLLMSDDYIKKRIIKGEPHILVHRGVGGNYAQHIKKALNHDHLTNEVDNKRLKVPVSPLTSWTTDWDMANRFAHERGDKIPGQEPGHGVVISRWMPVKHALHSGVHTVVHGQNPLHPSEKEIVFGHPDTHISLEPKHIALKDPNNMDYDARPAKIRGVSQKLAASEDSIPYEELRKGAVKKWITAGAIAANLGIPYSALAPVPEARINPEDHAKIVKPVEKIALHPDLKVIEQIESSGGKNLTHPVVTTGLNRGTRAIGRFGIMPLQVLEIINKSPALKEKYPQFQGLHYIKDHDKIHELVLSNPNLENELANTHWKRLERRFDGDKNAMAHAWFNGITGTLNKDPESIASHPYVQKFNKYKAILNIDSPKTTAQAYSEPFIKSEDNGTKVENFTPVFQKDAEVGKNISRLIESGLTHSLNNVGHFTHSSFLAGYDPDNSWLIKLEPTNRPAIKSVSGRQTQKEAAFYDIAKNIFMMEDYTPKVVLGHIQKDGQEWPAAAIKMYPGEFKAASEVYKQDRHKLLRVLAPLLESGIIHKLAGMLYVLGEADAHGQNILTDGNTIKLIDHGTAFANADFDPKNDPNIFIPYFMRAGRIKDKMPFQEKYANMPTVKNQKAKEDIRVFFNNVDPVQISRTLEKYQIDPKPIVARWLLLTKLINVSPNPDDIINMLWTEGPKLSQEVSNV